MHSFQGPSGESFFHYNGDFSGEVVINENSFNGETAGKVRIPMEDFRAFFTHVCKYEESPNSIEAAYEEILEICKRRNVLFHYNIGDRTLMLQGGLDFDDLMNFPEKGEDGNLLSVYSE